MSTPIESLVAQFSANEAEIERLTESVRDLALRYENVGWDLLSGNFDDEAGPDLDTLKEWNDKLSDLAASNPLMKRGAQLRHGYIFGKGVVFTDIKPAARSFIDDELNERALFSVQAYEEMNLATFTGGNFFTLSDGKKRVIRVPLKEITGVVTAEDSNEEIKYLQRSWNANGKARVVWYPMSTTVNPVASIESGGKRIAVDKTKVMFLKTSNKQVGWTFGVPDGLAALAWTLAYSEYLKDNSALVKAYSQFAWKVTRKTKAGVDNAAAQIRLPGGTGGAAVAADGNDLAPINPSGSQVNFNNGQPLAAMVATSLGVSVIALLGSPGAAGGSYGAAATLDSPTLIGMEAIQDSWAIFFRSVLRHLKSPNAKVEFPAIETDPVYRQIGAAAQALSVGGLTQQEFFDLCHNLFDISTPEKTLPGPDWFNAGASIVAAEMQAEQDKIDAEKAASDPIARQGNSGAVGSTTQGDTNNDGRTDTIS